MRPEVSAAVARAGDQWQLSCHPQSLYLRHKRVSSNRYLEQKSPEYQELVKLRAPFTDWDFRLVEGTF
jgi:hypothetical protein